MGSPLYALLDFILLFQPSASAMGGGSGGGAGAAGGCGGPNGQLVILPVMLIAMYFLMIRPQNKAREEHESALKKLKVGDVVRTDSGIRGEIAKLSDRDVDLIIADRVKINVLRQRIAGVEGSKAAEAEQPKG